MRVARAGPWRRHGYLGGGARDLHAVVAVAATGVGRPASEADPCKASRTTVSNLGSGPPTYVMVLEALAKPSRSRGITRTVMWSASGSSRSRASWALAPARSLTLIRSAAPILRPVRSHGHQGVDELFVRTGVMRCQTAQALLAHTRECGLDMRDLGRGHTEQRGCLPGVDARRLTKPAQFRGQSHLARRGLAPLHHRLALPAGPGRQSGLDRMVRAGCRTGRGRSGRWATRFTGTLPLTRRRRARSRLASTPGRLGGHRRVEGGRTAQSLPAPLRKP